MPKKSKKPRTAILNKKPNKYLIRRVALLSIVVIVLIACSILIIKYAKTIKIQKERERLEERIFGGIQEMPAEVTKFFTYGDHFQIYGKLSQLGIENFETAKLILVNEKIEEEYTVLGETDGNSVIFRTDDRVNSGLNLDKLDIGTYYLKLRVKSNNSATAKYYTLSNNSPYQNIDYYTKTKDGKNNQVKIEFSEYNTLSKKSIKCLKITVKESKLPDDVYDIVVDAGHGGKDAGVKAGGYEEKNLTLDVAKLLKTELETRGYKVKLTRDDENTDSFTSTNMYDENGRIDIACKSKAKLMISLHVNDGPKSLTGLEVYAPCNSDLSLARKMANTLVEQTFIEFSNNSSFKETDGVYIRKFTKSDIRDLEKKAENKNFEMYPIDEKTQYLYTIREVGGIATGAYVDGRNTAYAKNVHYNSNQGIECYQVEMGYIDVDLQKIVEEEEEYAYALAEAISEAWE